MQRIPREKICKLEKTKEPPIQINSLSRHGFSGLFQLRQRLEKMACFQENENGQQKKQRKRKTRFNLQQSPVVLHRESKDLRKLWKKTFETEKRLRDYCKLNTNLDFGNSAARSSLNKYREVSILSQINRTYHRQFELVYEKNRTRY